VAATLERCRRIRTAPLAAARLAHGGEALMAKPVEIVISNGRFHYTCPGGIGDANGMCSVPAAREKKSGHWQITTDPGRKEGQTLEPSIRCHACGWHGHIRDGQISSVSDSKVKID